MESHIFVEEYSPSPSNEDNDTASLARGERVRYWGLFSILCLLPLCFGGAHTLTAALFTFFCLTVVLFSLVACPGIAEKTLPQNSLRRGITYCLLGFIGISCAITLARNFMVEPHPIILNALPSGTGEIAHQTLLSFVAFLGVYILTCFYCSRSIAHASRIKNLIVYSGILIAAVALSHWFYDNGRLFWFFEANFVSAGSRARWPFVNPNHLGHFLLPSFFILFARTVQSMSDLLSSLERGDLISKKNPIPDILVSKTIKRAIQSFFLNVTGVVLVGVAISGSLSRGAWAGACAGIVVFVALSWLCSSSPTTTPHRSPSAPPLRRKSRRHGAVAENEALWLSKISGIRKLSRPIVALACIALVLSFLNERGRELVENRIEYGLLHSKDDIRWNLLSDTIPMIATHPLTGVGLGGWRDMYPRYMSETIAGINPVYLHSDPMQLLAELGILGVAPILLIALAIILKSRSALRHFRVHPRTTRSLIILLSALSALLVGSFLEFPFRMASYSSLVAVLLGITAFYADALSNPRD